MKLIIGNKNYSSWSLRGWLALKATGAAFEEVMIRLDQPETASRILAASAAGRVPVLIDGDIKVWDTLAIIEYLAERFPQAGLWPADVAARAYARAIVAEMHSGFTAVRGQYPMNINRPVAELAPNADAAAEIERISAIWRETRERFGQSGPFLFGHFSAADAFFAPIISRFATYRVPVGVVEQAYMEAVEAHQAMQEWIAAAQAESWVIPAYEVD